MTIKHPLTGAIPVVQPQRPAPVPGVTPVWAPEWPRLTPREIRQIVLDTLG